MYTLFCRNRTLAMQSSCLSPTEKLSLFLVFVSCPGRDFTFSFIWVRSRAFQMASSEYFSKGSKLYLPKKKNYLAKTFNKNLNSPNGTNEKHRVLRNNGQLRSKVIKTHFSNVNPINFDETGSQIHQSKQQDHQRWFTRTCSPNNCFRDKIVIITVNSTEK